MILLKNPYFSARVKVSIINTKILIINITNPNTKILILNTNILILNIYNTQV